ncbi:hypothetical protein ALQ18_00757 [Pseudomonas marginalis pv. marginalis]|nr:hypothetical protein ALQ18_00757 [Pseudomonas marginalis pv. marginalis]
MQERIAQELNIDRQLVKGAEANEIQRRIDFIKATLRSAGSKVLVLGISGGVDSLTAGRLCQLAVEQLRAEDNAARFIAMRLPYKTQVRLLATALGAPANLVHKQPTADLEELAPGKADEQAYGCTYAEIDAYLMGEPLSERVRQIVQAAYSKTAHKRALPITPA